MNGRPSINAQTLSRLGLCALLAGCISPDRETRIGDCFPKSPSERESNAEWHHGHARPFWTYGLNEPITNIDLGELIKGLRDVGNPRP